jgi:hypothetical protein
VEFLRAVARFILAQLAILGFLLLAPAVFVGVSIFVIAGGAGRNSGIFAFFYLAAGPFVSGVWTMIVLQVRNVYRVRKATGEYKYDLRRHLVVWGYLLYGFFGTLVAEVLFCFLYRGGANPKVWFAIAPFVVFSPLVAAWLARNRSHTSGKSAETVAMQNKLRAASLRIACLRRNGKSDEEILGLLDGDDHEAVLFQASLDNMDELRACPAGSMGELVHKRNQRYLREAR